MFLLSVFCRGRNDLLISLLVQPSLDILGNSSQVLLMVCPRYKGVIENYGMQCLLRFVSTEVPLRLVKWLASGFDVLASEFHLKRILAQIEKSKIIL